MKRNQFLHIKFLNLPYLSFSRGPSTKYNESFHVENKSTGKILNFSYTCTDTVDAWLHDMNERNPWNKNTNLVTRDKNFTEIKANNLIKKYLS